MVLLVERSSNNLDHKLMSIFQPMLLKGGQVLSKGEDYTANGTFDDAIA